MQLRKKRGFLFLLLVFSIGLAFFLGGQAETRVSAIPREDYEDIETLTNLLAIVKKNYVDEVSTKELVKGAINGMLNALDPHSAYLTPDLYKELQMDTQGRFSGLGIEITVKNGVLTVVSPIEETPADRAGIKAGDQIVKIEDEFTKDMSLIQAVQKMRGPRGSKITIAIKREGVPELISFTLVRDSVRVQSAGRGVRVYSRGPVSGADRPGPEERVREAKRRKGGNERTRSRSSQQSRRPLDPGGPGDGSLPRFRADCLHRRTVG